MWTEETSPLNSKPLSDPFLQMLSMSPRTFPGDKALPQVQSNSAMSTASTSTPNGWPQSQAHSHQEFVPQQQTIGFDRPRDTNGASVTSEQSDGST